MTASHPDLANPEQHQCCFDAPVEPQAVPMPFQGHPLAEAQVKTPIKWVNVWLSQGFLRRSSNSVSEKSHKNT